MLILSLVCLHLDTERLKGMVHGSEKQMIPGTQTLWTFSIQPKSFPQTQPSMPNHVVIPKTEGLQISFLCTECIIFFFDSLTFWSRIFFF